MNLVLMARQGLKEAESLWLTGSKISFSNRNLTQFLYVQVTHHWAPPLWVLRVCIFDREFRKRYQGMRFSHGGRYSLSKIRVWAELKSTKELPRNLDLLGWMAILVPRR